MLRRMQVGPCIALLTELQRKLKPCDASLASSTLDPAAKISYLRAAQPASAQRALARCLQQHPSPNSPLMALAPLSQLCATMLRSKAANMCA